MVLAVYWQPPILELETSLELPYQIFDLVVLLDLAPLVKKVIFFTIIVIVDSEDRVHASVLHVGSNLFDPLDHSNQTLVV